ncbi:MAG: phage holin [Faecalibacterium sp.]
MNTKLNISAATIARTAVLGLALTNQLLSAAGKPVLPIESAQLEQLVTSGLTVAASLWAWWKNNSFTQEALHGDQVMNDLKAQK